MEKHICHHLVTLAKLLEPHSDSRARCLRILAGLFCHVLLCAHGLAREHRLQCIDMRKRVWAHAGALISLISVGSLVYQEQLRSAGSIHAASRASKQVAHRESVTGTQRLGMKKGGLLDRAVHAIRS